MDHRQHPPAAKSSVSPVDSPTVGSLLVNHCGEFSHCPATTCPKIVLEMPMDHVALYRQFFCQLFLVIVQQFRIGHDDYGDRNSQGVENGAGSYPTRKLRASLVGGI